MNMHVKPKELLETTEVDFKSCAFDSSEKPNITNIEHVELGKPTQIWAYNNKQGELLGFICRFDLPGENGVPRKEIRPLSYISKDNAAPRWMWRGLPKPRPLYNLDQIDQRKYKKVIICEGEKAANAASKLFPNDLCTSPMFGAQAPHKTDWSPLMGRDVVIVGDNDEAGRTFADKVALLIGDIDDVAIQFLDIKHIGNQKISGCGTKLEATSICPAKYDLADALEHGWTSDLMETFIKDNKSKVLRDFVRPNWPFRLRHNHVERHVERKEGSYWEKVFSYLKVIGRAATHNSGDWSYVLEVKDIAGEVHQHLVKASELNGRGLQDIKAELASFGLKFQNRQSSDDLWRFIEHAPTKAVISLAKNSGWQDSEAFITPAWVEAKSPNFEVYFDTTTLGNCFQKSGSFSEWKNNIALPIVGNDLLQFAMCSAFASPLLKLTSSDSFGVHFYGSSSTGKTTALRVAATVWGKPSEYIKNWNLTNTALEGTAAFHNDTLICLDEISQADPLVVANAAYELANGQGKGRGNVNGGANERSKWRTVFLSNGELSFEEYVRSNSKRGAMAGQKTRILNVAADAGNDLGIFSVLPPNCPDPGSFANDLRASSSEYYGVAAKEFMKLLITDQNNIAAKIENIISTFVSDVSDQTMDGQVGRVARNFGLIAAAGELAISYKILPWDADVAIKAAKFAFSQWLKQRGGTKSDELIQGVTAVREFIQKHGDSRFKTMIDVKGSWQTVEDTEFDVIDRQKTSNQVGFKYLDNSGEFVYLIFTQQWRSEVCQGRDASLIGKELARLGHLKTSPKSNSVTRNIPGSRKARVYEVNASILRDDDMS